MVVKQHTLSRLCMLLAAMRLSEVELIALLRELRDAPLPQILSHVHKYKSLLDQESLSVQLPVEPVDPSSARESPISEEITSQIERLLVREAGLTKAVAAQALSAALLARNPRGTPAPFNAKDGFSRWLKQLALDFSPSEILHAAAMIRSSRVHAQGDDWLGKR